MVLPAMLGLQRSLIPGPPAEWARNAGLRCLLSSGEAGPVPLVLQQKALEAGLAAKLRDCRRRRATVTADL